MRDNRTWKSIEITIVHHTNRALDIVFKTLGAINRGNATPNVGCACSTVCFEYSGHFEHYLVHEQKDAIIRYRSYPV